MRAHQADPARSSRNNPRRAPTGMSQGGASAGPFRSACRRLWRCRRVTHPGAASCTSQPYSAGGNGRSFRVAVATFATHNGERANKIERDHLSRGFNAHQAKAIVPRRTKIALAPNAAKRYEELVRLICRVPAQVEEKVGNQHPPNNRHGRTDHPLQITLKIEEKFGFSKQKAGTEAPKY